MAGKSDIPGCARSPASSDRLPQRSWASFYSCFLQSLLVLLCPILPHPVPRVQAFHFICSRQIPPIHTSAFPLTGGVPLPEALWIKMSERKLETREARDNRISSQGLAGTVCWRQSILLGQGNLMHAHHHPIIQSISSAHAAHLSTS